MYSLYFTNNKEKFLERVLQQESQDIIKKLEELSSTEQYEEMLNLMKRLLEILIEEKLPNKKVEINYKNNWKIQQYAGFVCSNNQKIFNASKERHKHVGARNIFHLISILIRDLKIKTDF